MRVLGTSPGERLTEVAIVVYVCKDTCTCIYWNDYWNIYLLEYLKDQWTMPVVHGYDLQK